MDIIEKLEDLAQELKLNNLSTLVVDIKPWRDLTSTTPCFNSKEGAFILNPSVAVPIQVYTNHSPKFPVPNDYKGIVGIHRALLGFATFSKIETAAELQRILDPIINAGVKDLINNFGTLTGYKLSMYRPDGKVFRHLENSTAIEIRITAIKE